MQDTECSQGALGVSCMLLWPEHTKAKVVALWHIRFTRLFNQHLHACLQAC